MNKEELGFINIDLGTTNCRTGFWNKGNYFRYISTPSYLAFIDDLAKNKIKFQK